MRSWSPKWWRRWNLWGEREREGEGERESGDLLLVLIGKDNQVSVGGAELGHLGVFEGVLLFPGVFGVDVLDLLADCGVLLCLPGVPLCVLASEAMKSLFTPLCLDVVLQAWQVAI